MELFEGQMSLTDILNRDLPFINEMIEAKQKLLEDKERLRRRTEAEALKDSRKK